MTEAELIALLADGQRNGTHDVDAASYAVLDRAGAYRVMKGVFGLIGATAGMLKTAIQSDGVGVAAPIYATRVGRSGFGLPATNVVGLELEVGVVLGKDVGPETDLASAIDQYFTGIEIVGSRFRDRSLAGPNGGLADSMFALGYVIGTEPRPLRDSLEGATVSLEFAGRPIYSAVPRHSFGSVLASLAAYARSQHSAFPLRAGAIVTTGSLCGLVPITGTGHVVGRLGDDRVEFDIV
jgi:2-keto-4-pentenoate hydratase